MEVVKSENHVSGTNVAKLGDMTPADLSSYRQDLVNLRHDRERQIDDIRRTIDSLHLQESRLVRELDIIHSREKAFRNMVRSLEDDGIL